MKIILTAATALALGGSAFAYQTHTTHTTNPDTSAMATITVDPTVAITPLPAWTDAERAMWEQHLAFMPATWTAEERAAFTAMMAMPPANWTAEQRALYEAHFAALPSSWTAAQRAAYMNQVAALRTPWLSVNQTASSTTTTTLASAASPRVVHPSNANPERDARGIAVISDPAIVPDGYNGFAGTGMGGPLVDPATGETIEAADDSYPPCTATVTDNCVQTYEVGASAATWTRTNATGMGGPVEGEDEAGDNTLEDDALDVDTKPDGTLDVDGDLDGDGDNDIE